MVGTGFRVSGIRQVQARDELSVLESNVHGRTYDAVGRSGALRRHLVISGGGTVGGGCCGDRNGCEVWLTD